MRRALLLSLAIALLTSPSAAAHEAASGGGRGAQVVLAVSGAVALLGVTLLALSNRGADEGEPRRSGLRKAGVVAAGAGLLGVIAGPTAVDAISRLSCGGRPTTDAVLHIDRPSEGERFTSTEVPVAVTVEGGDIADETATTHTSGTGHIRITVDGQLVATAGQAEQRVEVAPGRHTLTVEYSPGDHTSFCPPVTEQRTIEVTP